MCAGGAFAFDPDSAPCVGVVAAHDPFFAVCVVVVDGEAYGVSGGDIGFPKQEGCGGGKVFTVSGACFFEEEAYGGVNDDAKPSNASIALASDSK